MATQSYTIGDLAKDFDLTTRAMRLSAPSRGASGPAFISFTRFEEKHIRSA